MNKNQLMRWMFLGAALMIAVVGLVQALHEVAYAGPICSNGCTCEQGCGNAVNPFVTCTDTRYCDGSPGTPTNCHQYCTNTKAK